MGGVRGWWPAFGAAVVLAVAVGAGPRRASAADAPPDVVILYADDMGWGDLAANDPRSRIPTPHLDRLAAEGVRCTDAHSSSGHCTPSRYALLHGRYHWRKFHGIVNAFGQPVLDPGRETIATLLRGRGYRTAAFGKWHLGWDWESIRRAGAVPSRRGNDRVFAPGDFDWRRRVPGGPLAHGFDRYAGDDVPNFPPYAWFEDDRITAAPTEALALPDGPDEGNWECRPGPMQPGWDFRGVMPRITAAAVEWIRAQPVDSPCFVYVAFTSPHAPIIPAEAARGRSGAGPYGDFVVQTDDAVGAILAAVEARGRAGDTLVIFSSDNGPERYAYERERATGHRSAGPFRGLKRDLWEGGHRVPLIARFPGRIPPGHVADGLLSQIDLFATIAAAAGAPIPAGSAEDSLDQLPFLGGSAPSKRTELVHNTNPDGYAFRQGDWLLVAAPAAGITAVPAWYAEAGGLPADRAGALYDLRADPGQRRDLQDTEPDRAAAMHDRLGLILGRRAGHP